MKQAQQYGRVSMAIVPQKQFKCNFFTARLLEERCSGTKQISQFLTIGKKVLQDISDGKHKDASWMLAQLLPFMKLQLF